LRSDNESPVALQPTARPFDVVSGRAKNIAAIEIPVRAERDSTLGVAPGIGIVRVVLKPIKQVQNPRRRHIEKCAHGRGSVENPRAKLVVETFPSCPCAKAPGL
jgi:hypothetical protein